METQGTSRVDEILEYFPIRSSIIRHEEDNWLSIYLRPLCGKVLCPVTASVKEDIWWQAVSIPGVTLIGTWCSAVSGNPSAALHEGTPFSTQLMRRASSETENG